MEIDVSHHCLLKPYETLTQCGGSLIDLKNLLEKSAPDTSQFGSYLEYLLFKGAMFNLHPMNLEEKQICLNHFRDLSADTENRGRCKICKLVCNKEKEYNNPVRRVSKQLALAIWQLGYPQQNWAFYDQPICDSCRKHLTANYVTDEIRSKCEHLFDWLYNKDVVYTPVSSEPDDDSVDDYEPLIDDEYCAQGSNTLSKFKQFLHETGFKGRCESTLSYTTLKEKSRSNLRNQIKQIFLHLLKAVAPSHSEIVWNDIIKDELKISQQEETNRKAMIALNDAMEKAEHSSTKRQLLAIVAADFSSSILRVHFPNVTDYQIKTARKHAYRCGRGAPVELTRSNIERYNEQQVLHFLEFVLSPSVTSDLPFGIRSMKMAQGEIIEIPNTCRNMIPTRIIRQYQNYCFETTNGEFQPLGFTSLMAILNACPASTRKSMAGIDEYSANGGTAFDSLLKLCDELSSYNIPMDITLELRKALQQSRNYIKIDYKLHISTNSTVPDHCSTFALSDTEEQLWSNSCDHNHDDICQQCYLLEMTLGKIESIIQENSNISDENRIRLMKSFTRDSELVQEWKKHQLRTVHQEAARDYALECLDEKSIFLVIDWAMKWLEKKYRQSQADFYALRGLSWHLTHVVRLQPNTLLLENSEKVFQNRTFCHCFDNCIQNGATVVSILQDVLMRVKQQHPEIELAYVRCDNAGCYHGVNMLLAVKELYETTGILIRRIDFSEAQAGKGPCDRKAAVIKGEIRRHIDEKHDCTTSAEFVEAAKSTHHLSIFSCELPQTKRTIKKNKWEGIKRYNNIEFILKRPLTFGLQPVTTTISSTSPAPFISPPSILTPSISTPSISMSSISTPFVTRSSQRSRINPALSMTTTMPSNSTLLSGTTTGNQVYNKSSIDLDIRVWRAFGIGVGKSFRFSNFELTDTIIPLVIDRKAQHLNNEWKSDAPLKEESSDDDGDDNDDKQMTNSDSIEQMDTSASRDGLINRTGFYMWECTHERCILQFRRRSDRDNHMDTGRHKFESNKVLLVEKAKMIYKSRLDSDTIHKRVPFSYLTMAQGATSLIRTKTLNQGWALSTKKASKRFNYNQKSFMIDAYDQGERTGFKMNPTTLSLDMPYIKVDGKFRFSPEEWLTSKQIKSFFSTLTRNRRKNKNSMLHEKTSTQQSISDNQSNNNSDLDHDGVEDSVVDSSNNIRSYNEESSDTDSCDSEMSDEDFDAQIQVLDMEDMLTTARQVLLSDGNTS